MTIGILLQFDILCCSMSSRTTSQLQADVNQCAHMLDTPWKATLMFEVATSSNRTPDLATIEKTMQMQDIVSFLGGQQPKYLRLYFNPQRYKTTPCKPELQQVHHDSSLDNNKNKSSNSPPQKTPAPPDFLTLKKDLEKAALQQDHADNLGFQFPLFSNGGSRGSICTQRFHCAGCIN